MLIRGLLILLSLGASVLMGCQSAKPELGSLGGTGGFSLDSKSKTMTAANLNLQFSGKCTSAFYDVEWSGDGGTNWTSIRTTNPSAVIDCGKTGVFSGTFDLSASSLGNKITAKHSVNLLFRGVTDISYSDFLTLLVTPPPGTNGPQIVVGSHQTTAGGYILKGRVGGNVTKSISSSDYVLQGHLHYK